MSDSALGRGRATRSPAGQAGSDGTKTIPGAAHRPDRDYRCNYSGGKPAADAKSC